MARKTSSIPTKIMTFGAFACNPEQSKIVFDQLFYSHLYRNTLIDIENKHRDNFRAIRRSASELLASSEKRVDEIDEQIKKLRAGLKKKKERTLDSQAQIITDINALKEERKSLYLTIKEEISRINKEHFDEADKEYEKRKSERVRGLGPNSSKRFEILDALHEEMLNEDWPSLWKEKLKLNIERRKELLDARNKKDVFSGTSLGIEDAVKRAVKDSKGEYIKKRKYEAVGKIGIQISNKGVSVADVLNGRCSAFKIEINKDVHIKKGKSNPERKSATVRLKISGEEKKGVYLDFNIILHRPLPDDGIIKWVHLYVSKVGFRYIYELQLTMESSTFINSFVCGGVAGINVGWKVLDNKDIRVATLYDGDSEIELILDAKIYEKYNRATNILSKADNCFDLVLATFVGFLKNSSDNELMHCVNAAMPRHLIMEDDKISLNDLANKISKFKDHKKLWKITHAINNKYLQVGIIHSYWRQWKKQRFAKKLDLFANFEDTCKWINSQLGITNENEVMAIYLEWWRRKDEHLTNMARGMQRNCLLRRREIYRVFVANLKKKYEFIGIEKFNKSKVAQRPDPEDDTLSKHQENANAIRQFAGVSVLTNALKDKYGDNLKEINAKDISINHFGCYINSKKKITPTPIMICPQCNKSYDQDLNGARHIFTRLQNELPQAAE